MGEKSKGGKKKGVKKQVKGKHKSLIFIIIGAVAGLAIIILLVVLFAFPRTKSYDEVNKALSQAGYSMYYNFNRNTYDENGSCFAYDYSKKEDCKREIDVENSIGAVITAVDNGEKYEIYAYYDLDYDNEESNLNNMLSVTIEHKLDDGEDYVRIFDKGGKNDYSQYSDTNGNLCHIINKKENVNGNYTLCSGDKEKALLDYQNNVDSMISKIGLTKEDLVAFFKEYGKKYVKPKYDEVRKEMKTPLPYDTIKKSIKEAGYTIEKTSDGGIAISDFKNANYYSLFSFHFTEDNYTFSFADWMYSDYILLYAPTYDYIVGADKESTCYYVVGERAEIEDVSDRVILDKYCSDKDKREIESMYNWFKFKLTDIGITRNELISFAKDYYSKH